MMPTPVELVVRMSDGSERYVELTPTPVKRFGWLKVSWFDGVGTNYIDMRADGEPSDPECRWGCRPAPRGEGGNE